ncbi:cytochrome P450 [Nocardia sp. NBC_01503]|uniref:cytochrome P450 n=1 Tax=Nocardia sp. NBC_01503 TaxID=2975997 RepID=UPI002E7B943E|nr:cytochrome P450 [Nocardia sp. NBC_01503]WTL29533.1 cytochrome P450 [Nocardia sp. NBC_01503]
MTTEEQTVNSTPDDDTPIGRVGFGLFEPATRANPYPVYHRLREQAPIYHSPAGIHIFSRYADAAAILCDPRFGYSEPRAPLGRALLTEHDRTGLLRDDHGKSVSSFLTRNPPDHNRLRRFVAPSFTPRAVARLAPRITAITDALLDTALASREVDLVESFAYALPFTVICELLDIPAADHTMVQHWSHTMARGLDPEFLVPPQRVEQRVRAVLETAAYFHELSAQRRAHPGSDLLSELATIEDNGDALTAPELLSTCLLLLVAGHESTASLIASGVLALLDHPDQLARLRAEPGLAAAAVEEVLRYDPPPQLVFRATLTDLTIGESFLPAGTMAMVLLGAANRDPAEFPDPDRLDLTRATQRHLAFSQGIHFCLGAPLARLQATIALRRLLERTTTVALNGQPRWKPNVALRGLEALPITLR